VLTGALFDAQSFALGAIARGPFFDSFVDESLENAFAEFDRKTGRRHETLSRYRLDDAATVLVAQGSAIETARCAADYIRTHHKVKVGVLGVHVLRPFPADAIGAALEGRERAFVLERVNTPLAGDPPLTREVRASLERSRSGPRHACQSVVYGVGGLPFRVADLADLCTRRNLPANVPLFLGISRPRRTSIRQPRRARVAEFDDDLDPAVARRTGRDARRSGSCPAAQAGGRARAQPAVDCLGRLGRGSNGLACARRRQPARPR
jgi:hypothetical protein